MFSKISISVIAAVVVLVLSAMPARAVQATISWVDNSTDETGFRVDRRDGVDTNPWVVQATTAPNSTSLNQTGLAVGTRYCYRIVAINTFGPAAPSNEACGTPDVPLPASGVTVVFAP